MRATARGLAILTLGTALAGCWMSESAAPSSSGHINALAPELSGEDLEGNAVRLNSLRGQVVLVDFWQANCPPCKAFHATERALMERFGDRGLAILGVFRDEDTDQGRRIHKYEKLGWPSLVDADGRLAAEWGVSGTPTIFLIDARGNIRYTSVGPASLAVLEKRIGQLLNLKQ
jgi:peroxiredoxin